MSEPLRVLITGATSGLGREMAVQLGRRGARVAVTGRREDMLRETAALVEKAGGSCLALAGEVSERGRVREHYAAVRQRWGGLDWAILNAGISVNVDARSMDAENYRRVFDVNVFGILYWLEAVLPDMVARGSGTVAGVSSLAAFRGMPLHGSYTASKAAVNSLLEASRVDLRGTGVKVVTICPGFVKSEITGRNDPKEMPFLLETADGASRILKAVEKGRSLAYFPWQLAWPLVFLLANLPNWIFDPFADRFLRRKKKPYKDPVSGA